MKMCWTILQASGITLLGSVAPTVAQAPVDAAFTYQGQLSDGAVQADGVYDLNFRLCNSRKSASGVRNIGDNIRDFRNSLGDDSA